MKQLNFEEVINKDNTSDLAEGISSGIKISDSVEDIQQSNNVSLCLVADVSCETDIEGVSIDDNILTEPVEVISQSDFANTENVDTIQYFNSPVTLYRSPDYLYPLCKVSGVVHVEGIPINGFISADAVKTGIGRIKGYIKASLIEK